MTSVQKIEAAERLAFVAKQMGFSKARVAYWDAYNSEYSTDTIREICDQYGTDTEVKVHLGLFLTFDDEPIRAIETALGERAIETAIIFPAE